MKLKDKTTKTVPTVSKGEKNYDIKRTKDRNMDR